MEPLTHHLLLRRPGQALETAAGSEPWEIYTVLADDRPDVEGVKNLALSAVHGDGTCCETDGNWAGQLLLSQLVATRQPSRLLAPADRTVTGQAHPSRAASS